MTGRREDIEVYFRVVLNNNILPTGKRSPLKETKDKYNGIVNLRTSLNRQLLLNTSAKLELKTSPQPSRFDIEVRTTKHN